MSPQDFEKSADELCVATQDLYSTISSPFEGNQITDGYRAKLYLPVSHHSSFYENTTYQDYVWLSSGMVADKRKDWQVCLGYDDQAKEIGAAAVSIPLQHAENNRSLLFRATPFNGFIRFLMRGDMDNGEVLPTPFEQTETVRPSFIGQLLMSAGYDLQRFSTHPNSLRLQLADLVDSSNDATITETVSTRSVDGINATFTRTTRCVSAIETNHTLANAGPDYASSLQATLEFDQPNASQREQLVIQYDAADYIIPIPRIYKRVLFRKNSILAQAPVEDDLELNRTDIEPTADTLNRLSQDMIDVLAGK